jgi:hypothetical protein
MLFFPKRLLSCADNYNVNHAAYNERLRLILITHKANPTIFRIIGTVFLALCGFLCWAIVRLR